MANSGNTTKMIVVVVAIVVGTCVLAGPIAVKAFLSNRGRILLLCKTDHQALLKAGRKVFSQVPLPRNRTPDGYRIGGKSPIPKGVNLSQAIVDLAPRDVAINYDGYLVIEMGGTMDHFGVRVYPEDFQPPNPFFNYGDLKLVEGLWYYDEEYSDPEYATRIDALLQKNKYRK